MFPAVEAPPPPRRYPCAICAKTFGARYLLGRHQSTHSRRRDFLCCVCGKAFLRSSSLTVHSASHRPPSRRRLYDCDVCAKQFERSSVRNIHRASHEQKMHICSYCGKAFHQKSTLNTHELIHTDTKPFLCNYCDQTFRQNSNLKVHISKQHHNVMASEKPEISQSIESHSSCTWDDSTNAGKEPQTVQLENTFSQKKKESKRSLMINQPCENVDQLKVGRNERDRRTRKTLKRKFSQEPIQDSTVTNVNVVKTGDVVVGNSNNLKSARKIKSNDIFTSTTTDRLPLGDASCLQTVKLRSLRASDKSITLEAEPLNASDALNDSKHDVILHAFPLDTEDTLSDSNNSVNSPCCKSYFANRAVEECDGNCLSQFPEGDEVSDDVLVAQRSERPTLISEMKVSQNIGHCCDTSALTTNPSIRGQMKIPNGNENIHKKSGIEGVVPVSSRIANDSLGFIAELNDRADVATRKTLESALCRMSRQRQRPSSAEDENSTDTSADNLSVVENILENVYRSSNLTGAIIRQSNCLLKQDTVKPDIEDAKSVKKCLSVRSRSNVMTRNHGPKNPPPKKLLYVHLITPAKQVKNLIWNCSINKNRC